MKRTHMTFALFASLAVLLSAATVNAQEKAFKITGEGVTPEGLPLPPTN